MMKTDGARKRWGRFFKNGDILLSKVEIQAYDFKEIMQHPVVGTDNLNSNVIHSRLHEEEELFKAVRDDDQILGDLMTSQMRLPIIFPRNFTKEWTEEKKRAHRRHASGNLDEDDLEQLLEQEEEEERLATEAQHRYLLARKKKLGEENLTQDEVKALKEVEKKINSMNNPVQDPPETSTSEKTDSKSDDEPATTEPSQDKQIPEETLESSDQGAPTNSQNDQINPEAFEELPSEEDSLQSHPEEIQPPEDEPEEISSTQETHNAQDNQLAQQDETLQDFKAGFKMLEKALGQVRNLEKNILQRSQENFMIMTKALANGIFNKEIDLHPDKFMDVIKRAIEENFDQEDVEILVHPKMKGILQKSGLESEIAQWGEDDSIDEHDFKIISNQKSIKSGISNIVEKMIDQLQVDLYEDEQQEGLATPTEESEE